VKKGVVHIGADHGGFALKESLKKYLSGKGYDVRDKGNLRLDSKDDYPDYAFAVARAVSREKSSKGILICSTGQGVCIAANKIKGVRGVLVHDVYDAKRTRNDEDANVLCLAGRRFTSSNVLGIVNAWLSTPFANVARHKRRIRKLR